MKINISDNDKAKYLNEHFYYEVDMLIYSVMKLNKTMCHSENNLALDSFAIHTRTLYGFFSNAENTYNQKDDALAEHFISISKDQWDELIKSEIEILDKLEVSYKTNKQVAHLTYKRLEYDKTNKGWEINPIACSILQITLYFIDNIKPEYIPSESNNLEILKNKIIQMLQNK